VNRGVVLICCLLAAAGVAAYSYYSDKNANQTPVYTVLVPQRPPESSAPVLKPALPPQRATATPGDRASLARQLQRELKRVGCYSGEINGVWTTSSRMAMKTFTDQVNATLPIDNPDYVLLSLVQGHQGTVCGTTDTKVAVPDDKAALPGDKAASPADKTAPPGEKSTTTVGTAVPAAAAVGAIAATRPPAGPKADPKPAADDRPRPAAVAAPPAEPPSKTTQPDQTQRAGGPVPAEGVYERRPRRHTRRATSRPPKIVRDVMRALGIRVR
jgi:hypothetical protein